MQLRQLKNGDKFILIRTGGKYTFHGVSPHFGNDFMVKENKADANITTMNGQCRVKIIEGLSDVK